MNVLEDTIQFNLEDARFEELKNQLNEVCEVDGTRSLLDIVNSPDITSDKVRLKIVSKEELRAQRVYEASCFQITLDKTPCKLTIMKDQTDSEEVIKDRLSLQYQRMLIASVTHEIRTPLNIELGMLDTISELRDWPKVAPYVHIAKKNMQLISYLVNDVPDLCRFGEPIALNRSCVNIREILHECEELTRFQVMSKKLSMRVEVAETVPRYVITDEARYRRVVLNLLLNSIKYTTQGAITISLEWKEPNALYTSVIDTGAGIKPELQSRLFEFASRMPQNQKAADMFVNPQGTTISPQAIIVGIGLGLTMCKKLSVALGGNIEAKSALGLGSKFTFWVQSLPEPEEQKVPFEESKTAPTTTTALRIQAQPDQSPDLAEPQYTTDAIMEVLQNPSRDALPQVRRSPVPANPQRHCKNMSTQAIIACKCAPVLIVDDEPMNLLVIQSYLRSVGRKGDLVLYL